MMTCKASKTEAERLRDWANGEGGLRMMSVAAAADYIGAKESDLWYCARLVLHDQATCLTTPFGRLYDVTVETIGEVWQHPVPGYDLFIHHLVRVVPRAGDEFYLNEAQLLPVDIRMGEGVPEID